jgi:hypothetical protein
MTKEEIYDAQISPLVKQIIEICKAHKIALIADFGLDDDMHCTTSLLADEYLPSDSQLEAHAALRPKPIFALAETVETKPDGSKNITIRRIS